MVAIAAGRMLAVTGNQHPPNRELGLLKEHDYPKGVWGIATTATAAYFASRSARAPSTAKRRPNHRTKVRAGCCSGGPTKGAETCSNGTTEHAA
jgi:hypothetical protein